MAGITWKGGNPGDEYIKRWRAGVLNLMADVEGQAQKNAPYKTGALRNSARIRATKDGAVVAFGTSRVDYALLRHEKNNLHPDTVRYLARAAEEISRGDLTKYFRN